jgi:glycosyltransferase involved in cell wall biosynthesis
MLLGAIASVLVSPLITSASQVIVVDDDSTDDTRRVAAGCGVRVVSVSCHHPSGARNAGLQLVGTPYVTFLDDDDAWLPGNLEAQLSALESDEEAAFAYGLVRGADEDLTPLPATFPQPPLASGLAPEKLHLAYPQLGVVLFRTNAVTEVGGFDPAIRYHQDADLMLRVAARRPIIGIETVGLLYRLRSPSRQRANYHWAMRDVTRWAPRHLGIGLKPSLQFRLRTRGLFFSRFCEDAAACRATGDLRGALLCLARAVWISPVHVFRHPSFLLRPHPNPMPSRADALHGTGLS